ncbi:MAG: hypothetical protein DRI86_12580 [Bacteroidetes bacterium]|nr:MAG: hypothetical protein DRI86_12580 [Bacteroidota bacterium]
MAFITGASGLLGSHLVFTLLNNGEDVFALKRKNSNIDIVKKCLKIYSNDYIELFDRINWVEGDILDFYLMDEMAKQHKEVYHTAAFVSFIKKDHSKILDINIQGTANIADACKNHGSRLVYASSIASLGRGLSDNSTTEKDFRDSSFKSSVYSKSKFLAEMEVWRAIAEGLDAVMVNPSVIIGPGDWNKSSTQLFKTVNNGLKFYTDGTNGYVDVRDVANIMYKLMKSSISAERYILSSEDVTYKDLFSNIALELGKKPPSILANKLLSGVAWRAMSVVSFMTSTTPLITKETSNSANSHYSYSSKKIIEELDYKFIPIDESIKHTARIFKSQNN